MIKRSAAGTIAIAVLAWHVDAAAQPACTPVVQVSGDPVLARPVMALLRDRGVKVDGASKCGVMTAVLTGSGERTRITIVDVDGRTVERMAEDARAAATAIESWARRDITAPLLEAREAPAAAQDLDREQPRTIVAPVQVVERLIEVGGAAEAGLAGDGSIWTGARAHACVTVGPVCAGALLRFARDTESGGDSIVRDTSRSALELLLSADLPLRGRRFFVAPGAALGHHTMRARRRSGDHESNDAVVLALRAHAAAGYRITSAWSLRAELALGAFPFAPRVLAESPEPSDPDNDLDDAPPLAGVPRLQAWFGIGMTYGAL
jgi:hypothetical protein